jgi:hypothetical protein
MKKAQREATELAIKNMGGAARIAERFGISMQAVGWWPKRGVPLKFLKVMVVEGRVPREKLRPELYAWPG